MVLSLILCFLPVGCVSSFTEQMGPEHLHVPGLWCSRVTELLKTWLLSFRASQSSINTDQPRLPPGRCGRGKSGAEQNHYRTWALQVLNFYPYYITGCYLSLLPKPQFPHLQYAIIILIIWRLLQDRMRSHLSSMSTILYLFFFFLPCSAI